MGEPGIPLTPSGFIGDGIEASELRFDLRSLGTVLRVLQRDYLMPALGLTLVGLLLLKSCGRPLRFLIAANTVSLLVWVILEFAPGSTVVPHASYAMVVVFLFAGCYSLSGNRVLAWPFAIVHAAWFLFCWVLTMPGNYAVRSGLYRTDVAPGPALVTLAAAAGVVLAMWRSETREAAAVAAAKPTIARKVRR
jgi:hypothetical protein